MLSGEARAEVGQERVADRADPADGDRVDRDEHAPLPRLLEEQDLRH